MVAMTTTRVHRAAPHLTPDLAPDLTLGLGPTRAKVLGTLQELGAPSTAADVAGRLDIHANTARFHLDALVAAGLVERAREERRRPGRPQVHYSPTTSAPATAHRSFRMLAEILARHMAEKYDDPHREGLEAGRSYGRLIAPGGDADGPDREGRDAVAEVFQQLDEMGFESEWEARAGTDPLEVTNCPFLEVAEGHLDVVCAVHQGLMDGMLAEVGSPLRVERLDPLVGPSRCVAHLRIVSSGPVDTRGSRAAR